MTQVCLRSDVLRSKVSPNAVLAHSYIAYSDYQAFQHNNDWHGFGQWSPPVDLGEHFFTEEEQRQQQDYLRHRKVG